MSQPRGQMRVVLLRGDREVASWPLAPWHEPDLRLLEVLLRLQLRVRRAGCRLEVRDACPELLGFLELLGLQEVLTGRTASGGR